MKPRRESFPNWLLAAAAMALVLAYANALVAGFQFDDFNVIVDNPAVHSLAAWWNGMPSIRPLLKLSYTLNWLADPGPVGFHAVNILLHLVNVTLVWHLTAHLPIPPAWEYGPERSWVRVLATLLFALHPIQTESVTYISGRSMLLMSSFGLAALLCWLQAGQHSRPATWRLLALLLFTAAILSKEVAVVLPLALPLLREQHSAPRWQGPLLALYVTTALVMLLALFGYQRLLTMPLPRGLLANLASEINALYYLLGQLFRPHALNIDPDLPELTAWNGLLAAQVLGIAVVAAMAWMQRRQRPWLSFGIAWFLLLLLPTHSLIPRLDLASERHLYLSGLGLFWLAGLGLTALLARLPGLATPSAGTALIVLLACTAAAFTASRNRDYRDETSLWRATVRLSPYKARAWNNLGYAHALAGQTEAARTAFQNALSLDPNHARSRANLSNLDAGRLSPVMSTSPFPPGAHHEQ